MYRIKFWFDATNEKSVVTFPSMNMERACDLLNDLVYYHNELNDRRIINKEYLYIFEVYNSLRLVWKKWVDIESGIDDPLEYLEYCKEIVE